MKVAGKNIVVTGAGSGIGRAMALRFAREGARAVTVADLAADRAQEVAASIGPVGRAIRVDVGAYDELRNCVEVTEETIGPIDLFCSNAGISGSVGGPELPDKEWNRVWQVNVMAQVYAARILVPLMSARGGGYLLNTASSAGVLISPGMGPYSVTKHASVALSEWIGITYHEAGIKVSCLCPGSVQTDLYDNTLRAMRSEPTGAGMAQLMVNDVIDADAVAGSVISGLADENFFIYPHADVAELARRRMTDHERWLRGMRRLTASTSDQ